jgi:putative tryptophan/tyrosine transport system substrate-binding protein
MRRREFITLLGGAAVARPLAAHAQQPERMRRIGVLILYPENDPEGQLRAKAFRQGLEKFGWVAGRNIQIDFQWGWVTPIGYDQSPLSCCSWRRT